MKGPITIDAGADIEQTEDVGLKARQNNNISAIVTRLDGDGVNRSRLRSDQSDQV